MSFPTITSNFNTFLPFEVFVRIKAQNFYQIVRKFSQKPRTEPITWQPFLISVQKFESSEFSPKKMKATNVFQVALVLLIATFSEAFQIEDIQFSWEKFNKVVRLVIANKN